MMPGQHFRNLGEGTRNIKGLLDDTMVLGSHLWEFVEEHTGVQNYAQKCEKALHKPCAQVQSLVIWGALCQY